MKPLFGLISLVGFLVLAGSLLSGWGLTITDTALLRFQAILLVITGLTFVALGRFLSVLVGHIERLESQLEAHDA